jgi:hypothetical protein
MQGDAAEIKRLHLALDEAHADLAMLHNMFHGVDLWEISGRSLKSDPPRVEALLRRQSHRNSGERRGSRAAIDEAHLQGLGNDGAQIIQHTSRRRR